MVFSSTIFLFVFLPILLVSYFFAAPKYRNSVLLVMSLIFYSWGEPKNIVFLIVSVIANYYFGIIVETAGNKGVKKAVLVFAVFANLALLFVFKYLRFVLDICFDIAKTNIEYINLFGSRIDVRTIVLPIGISFFTFQTMSYVIDVYWEKVSAQRNLVNLALYVALFPQLIAGPIVRYIDVEKQIEHRETNWTRGYEGIRRFIIGFSKKILIADVLASMVDVVFAGNFPSLLGHWLGIAAYSLQIYFDFSGYSDMAIGLGKIFGFDFLENFNYPYISQSVQEFWRRWHISLSSWFRDYLYIPLGGNRKGTIRTYINLTIVFFMTGLWHGASFNFIVWGLYYAVFLILERLGWGKLLKKIPRLLRHSYTLLVVLIGWVFFRADTLTGAMQFIRHMFILSGNDFLNARMIFNPEYGMAMAAGIVFSIPHTKIGKKTTNNAVLSVFTDVLIITVFFLSICYMVGSGFSPFLYFRF